MKPDNPWEAEGGQGERAPEDPPSKDTRPGTRSPNTFVRLLGAVLGIPTKPEVGTATGTEAEPEFPVEQEMEPEMPENQRSTARGAGRVPSRGGPCRQLGTEGDAGRKWRGRERCRSPRHRHIDEGALSSKGQRGRAASRIAAARRPLARRDLSFGAVGAYGAGTAFRARGATRSACAPCAPCSRCPREDAGVGARPEGALRRRHRAHH